LSGYGLKKPIVALSNGIDLKEYAVKDNDPYDFRQTYKIQENEKVIIGVGHYIERKGILDFVEMAKKLPQYKFIWFGYTDPNLIPSKIKNALRVELPNLIFAGYVEKNQLKKAYAAADLFWFPTWEETEGIVLLEAMASRIPVLVRDIEIYREWLPEHVVVHKAKDFIGFEHKIKEFFSGSLPDLTDAAYELVCENDIEVIGSKLYLLYKQYFTPVVSQLVLPIIK
jgi:1,2-diacylglycerol-3-alpha-glucose alpha-1,2-glucosyltransferase